MSHQNIAAAKRWFQVVWNERRGDEIENFVAADGVSHMETGDIKSPEEFRGGYTQFLAAFPDLHIEVEETVADETNVVVRWYATGTHRGEGLGLKATGRPIAFRGMTWLKFRNGLMVEGWDAWNFDGLRQKLL